MSHMDEESKVGKPISRRPRRVFTDEFRAGAVRLVLDEGKTIPQVARDLELTRSALRTWVERARADRTKGRTGLTTAEREELAKLRKEVRELRMERDILNEAAVRSTGLCNTKWLNDRHGGTVEHADDQMGTFGRREGGPVAAVESGRVRKRDRSRAGTPDRHCSLHAVGPRWDCPANAAP